MYGEGYLIELLFFVEVKVFLHRYGGVFVERVKDKVFCVTDDGRGWEVWDICVIERLRVLELIGKLVESAL